MEADRFDRLTRRMATPATRRVTVRTSIAAGILGAFTAMGVVASTRASPSATPSPCCAAGLTQCDGACVDLSSNLHHCGACGALCQSGLVPVECRNGVCERANCPEGITYCGAADGCRDLTSDPLHCGACQNPCPSGVCSSSVCLSG